MTKIGGERRLNRWSIYAIVLLPVAAVAGYSYFKIDGILSEAARARRRQIATLAASVLNEKFDRLADIGSSVAARPNVEEFVRRGRWPEAISNIAGVPKIFPFIDRVFLTDAGGRLMADAPALPGVVGKNFAFRGWYREVRSSGRPSISEVYRREAAPQLEMLAVAVPIRGARGEAAGYLVLQVRTSTLLQWVKEIPTAPGSNVDIVDQTGRLAARQSPSSESGAAREGETASIPLPRFQWRAVAWQIGGASSKERALRILLAVYALLLALTLILARVLIRTLEALQANEADLAQARDAALETARFKSEFVANISHEIRTPMNAIIGLTELLMMSPLTVDQRQDMNAVNAAGTILLSLINDVLDFSKLEAGKMAIENLDFDLRGAIEDVFAFISPPARGKGLRIGFVLPGDMATPLSGDQRRLKQILTNLLSNAVKFTERGEVSLRVETERETDTHVSMKFLVIDSGIGISPENRERLFQAFVQADSSTTRNYGGTGLGLFISRMLAETMGGTVDAESVPGRGSTFCLRLEFRKRPALRTGDALHLH